MGRINETARSLRPNSANALLVSEVVQQEENRRKRQRIKRSKSKSMVCDPSGTRVTTSDQNNKHKLQHRLSSDMDDNIFEDFSPSEHTRSRPLSEICRSTSGRPKSGPSSRPSSSKRAESFKNEKDYKSNKRDEGNPVLEKHSRGDNLSLHHSFNDAKPVAKPEIVSKSKSFDIKPKLTKEQKEKAALAKIEEKRLRVEQKQLEIQRKEQQMMWLKYISHLSRTG